MSVNKLKVNPNRPNIDSKQDKKEIQKILSRKQVERRLSFQVRTRFIKLIFSCNVDVYICYNYR